MNYVAAAYGLSVVIVGGYVLSVILRRREVERTLAAWSARAEATGAALTGPVGDEREPPRGSWHDLDAAGATPLDPRDEEEAPPPRRRIKPDDAESG